MKAIDVKQGTDGDTGIWYSVPYADYAAWPGVSRGRLWTLYSETPAHYRWEADHPEEVVTPAMREGEAIHTAILEPDSFANRYDDDAPINPRTEKPYGTDTKKFEEWAAACEARGVRPLPPGLMEHYEAIGAAVHAHPVAGPLIRSTKHEVSIQWRHGPTGLLLKGRPDAVGETKDGLILVDLKSTRSAAPQRFGRDAYTNGYVWQLATYRMGLQAVTQQEVAQVLVLAIEKQPPYGVALYEAGPGDLAMGEDQVTDALRQLQLCERYKDWPCYPEGVEDLILPGWAGQEWTPFADGLEMTLQARAKRAGRPLPAAPPDDDDVIAL